MSQQNPAEEAAVLPAHRWSVGRPDGGWVEEGAQTL